MQKHEVQVQGTRCKIHFYSNYPLKSLTEPRSFSIHLRAILKMVKMKKLFIVLAAGLILAACKSSDKKPPVAAMTQEEKDIAIVDSANFTSIEWLDSTYKDMGKIKEGEKVNVVFHFKNAGTKNLVIADVTAGCGCTVPEKPQRPYAPGEEGEIKATFDSSDKHGEVNKQIYVKANTNPGDITLNFRAEITN